MTEGQRPDPPLPPPSARALKNRRQRAATRAAREATAKKVAELEREKGELAAEMQQMSREREDERRRAAEVEKGGRL